MVRGHMPFFICVSILVDDVWSNVFICDCVGRWRILLLRRFGLVLAKSADICVVMFDATFFFPGHCEHNVSVDRGAAERRLLSVRGACDTFIFSRYISFGVAAISETEFVFAFF